ncbi:MAG: hypothetical protein ABUK01_16820 [Leptospirales bacterium]
MKKLLQKLKVIVNKYPGVFIACIIAIVTIIIVIKKPVITANDSSSWFEEGKEKYEQGNYTQAFKDFRKAKYYNPKDFENNYYAALSLLELPPTKNHEYLLRHYLSESKITAATSIDYQKLIKIWDDENIKERFNTIRLLSDKKISALKKLILKQNTAEEVNCKTFAACEKVADKAFKKYEFVKAEQFYIRAIQHGKPKETDEPEKKEQYKKNLYKAMFQVGIINLNKRINNDDCEKISWGGVEKNDLLQTYYDPDIKNCAKRAERIFKELRKNYNITKKITPDVKDKKIIHLAIYQGASIVFSFKKPNGRREQVATAFKYFSYDNGTLIPVDTEKIAALYRKIGDHMSKWDSDRYKDRRSNLYKAALVYYETALKKANDKKKKKYEREINYFKQQIQMIKISN